MLIRRELIDDEGLDERSFASMYPLTAKHALASAVKRIEDDLGDRAQAASVIGEVLQDQVRGYNWDEVVPVVPSDYEPDLSELEGRYDDPSISRDRVAAGLAASLLGLERTVVNDMVAGYLPDTINAPAALRRRLNDNLYHSLGMLGYEAGLTDRYGPVVGSAGITASASTGTTRRQVSPAIEHSYLSTGQTRQMLNQVLDTNLPVSGPYDADLADAVRSFQTLFGLPADGVLGPRTTASLLSLFGSQKHGGGNG